MMNIYHLQIQLPPFHTTDTVTTIPVKNGEPGRTVGHVDDIHVINMPEITIVHVKTSILKNHLPGKIMIKVGN